jgi:Carbohydrate family 9 binding domain-like/Domain of unknown function (DUF5916)
MKRTLLILTLLAISFNIWAIPPISPQYATQAPIIDGDLSDQIWKSATKIDRFITFAPDFGKQLPEPTTAYLAYDEENIYFAFECIDYEADKIKASFANRDNIHDQDWICINLDSFDDHQGLYAFYVNPLGIQADSRYSAGVEDHNIDIIWYSAGILNENGYNVEVRIPLKSIRYRNTNPVQMGVFLERKISRRSEHGVYPEMDPEKGYAFLTQMAPIEYHNVKHYRLVEILPAVTYNRNYSHESGDFDLRNDKADISLTTKLGLTSDLILDGTYNPDFSQVEADAGQVDINLRHSLFYDEKRPFFLEGRDNFTVAAIKATEVDPVRNILHTRTIVNPITGLKLSGKIGAKNTVASIYSMDELIDKNDEFAHFAIARYKRTLKSDSYIGGIYAGRELDDGYNRNGGIDGQIRMSKASTFDFNAIASTSELSDTSLELNGYTYGVKYGHQSRNIDYHISVKEVSEDFQADMGYVTRTGLRTFGALVKPKVYPKIEAIERIDYEIFTAQTQDFFSNKWETFNHISALYHLWGRMAFKVKYSYSTEIFLNEKFNTGGFHLYTGGPFTNKFYWDILYRRVNAIYYSVNPYQGYSNRISSNFIYQPFEKLNYELNLIFYDFKDEKTDQLVYEYPIFRNKLTFQLNKYLFVRGIVEYNRFKKDVLTDFLVSFTYIPGTVIHLGYGSMYEKTEWDGMDYVSSNNFIEMQRGFFFKASYLWRM